ncbi:hypothetical protein ACJ73_04648 [Blastomyces percursus]|uniref:Phosphatidic acid phosphatase type 2/haloperoxidase domain-containing protein n=1 Tax=Blastomyces percursus TaxID=1658174 RepID=A0A1J9R7L7_9EURO|nr:hypothetical protein ACJ73_04648 [Blastomyces percursus]
MATGNLLATVRRDWWFSKRLIASYVFDWIIILVTAAAARILKLAEPNRNPFSLTDPSISYPFTVHETVRVTVLVLVSLIAPAVIIFLGSIFFIPGLTAGKHAPKATVWRRKLWEWNVGWMGLGIAYAGTYASTEALKVIYGKPRPDLLSRCNPNLSDIAAHVVGGLGERLDGAPLLVSYTICQNTSEKLTWDGFVSFPSGHASLSFAGLTYLTLWFCAKFSVSIPYLAPRHYTPDTRQTAFSAHTTTANHSCSTIKDPPPFDEPYPSTLHHDESTTSPTSPSQSQTLIPLRTQSAAPPTYLLPLAAAPIVAATYIASSRWFDNRHFGFDILFGSLLGIFFAWLGFRWYHLPLGAGGAGWAWGARSPERAFFAGVGVDGYVRHEDLVGRREGNEPEVAAAATATSSSSSSRPGSRVVRRGEDNV